MPSDSRQTIREVENFMLQKMRDRTQTFLFKFIVGAIIFVLCVFGFGAFNLFVDPDPAAAVVNGEDISRRDLEQRTEQRRRQLAAQLGENADPDLLDPAAIAQSVLDGLVDQKLLELSVADIGLRSSDYQVDTSITETPDFQIDGQFDADTYRMLLTGANLTPVRYRELLRASMSQAQLTGAYNDTSMLFDWELELGAKLFKETRDVAYLLFDRASVEDEINVTEDDISAYYDANLPDFMAEEKIDIDYVSLSLDALVDAEEFAPSDAEVRAEYDANREAFEPEERRRAAHILVSVDDDRTEAEARDIVDAAIARLDSGETFAALAEELSDDPGSKANGGDLGFAGKGVYVPEFEAALYELAPGQLSAPVVTQFGVHLIRLEDIETTSYPDFEAQREALTGQLRRDNASERFAELKKELGELAYDSPDSLDEIVATLALPRYQVADVTRGAGTGVFVDAALRDAAFDDDVMLEGFNSEALEVSPEQTIVLRVADRTEPRQKTLQEVSADIESRLRDDAAALLMAELADEQLAALNDGAATTAVADATGRSWTLVEKSERVNADAPREVISRAFELERPALGGRSVGVAEYLNNDRALVVVSAAYDGSKGVLTEVERGGLERQLGARTGQLEFDGFFRTLKDTASIRRSL
ncbi:MAG: SurA N-terminal domain-containing protein [Pseudomonadota bacterium]